MIDIFPVSNVWPVICIIGRKRCIIIEEIFEVTLQFLEKEKPTSYNVITSSWVKYLPTHAIKKAQ
jgi:hypothetical protein